MTQKTANFRIEFPDGTRRDVMLAGRPAWALHELIKAGSQGVTPINNPAPRWSAYIHELRQAGVPVLTTYERHGGPYAGNHARYILDARVWPARPEAT